jgi:hypothetical protein
LNSYEPGADVGRHFEASRPVADVLAAREAKARRITLDVKQFMRDVVL